MHCSDHSKFQKEFLNKTRHVSFLTKVLMEFVNGDTRHHLYKSNFGQSH